MADLPEISEFTEGVRALEPSDPVRNDVVNNLIQPLVNRTNWLRDNMNQGGGGEPSPNPGFSPVEWIEANDSEVYTNDLTPGTMYILDTRNGMWLDILVQENSSIPVGSEFHFVCAGDQSSISIYEAGGEVW